MNLLDALGEVDAIFDRAAGDAIAPGIGYGVVAGGALVHGRGIGTRRDGEAAPVDADSVFRIASLTKSFTAAAVLGLRDEGRLALDEPVAHYVPHLAGVRGPTRDSPPISIRHLLTHAAGLATDDPWGDRQQSLALDRFAELLRTGASFAWSPGTRFEYSNLGYGILGRVIEAVSGVAYDEYVRDRVLRPLGMLDTGFHAQAVPPDRLAHGYVQRDGAWLAEPIEGYGALAAMGGLFSTVRDLGRWVSSFTDSFPPRDDPEEAAPLSRASRREMQGAHHGWAPEVAFVGMTGGPAVEAEAYGYGLHVIHDLDVGTVVGHSGGYPGFGSNMRWHPASGLGVVALANARYAPIGKPVREALKGLVRGEAAPIRRTRPADVTTEARRDVERLLEEWDDGLATGLFAMNVELDEPLERRRAEIERLRTVHGRLRPDADQPPESETPLHLVWWCRGEGGRVKVEIRLSPEPRPRVQALTLTSVPDPPAELRRAGEAIASALAAEEPRLPSDVRLAASIDRPSLARELRIAAARYRASVLGPAIAGDGEWTATWRCSSPDGRFDLKVALDAATGEITLVSLVPAPIRAPLLAD